MKHFGPVVSFPGGESLGQILFELGPLVRVELSLGEHIIEAETTRQRHAELQLAVGQRVLLWPRQARFFLRDGWEGTSLESVEELARSSAML